MAIIQGLAWTFDTVNEQNIADAGYIHAESWKESHKSFCSPEFVAKHTPEAQTEYLRREMARGKRIFLLLDHRPVGIVSVFGHCIENLYVLPTEQKKGYGTQLLQYALGQCNDVPTLWVLNTNQRAYDLYQRNGFLETGNRKALQLGMYEIEMRADAQTLYHLAMKHIYGDGVSEDNELAVKLLTYAHNMGHTEATYNLGICYHYGYGTEIDVAKAYALYLESANNGYGKGMELVGRFYNRGIYVEKDGTQAEYWLRKAIESGDAEAVEEAKTERNQMVQPSYFGQK